MDYKLVSWFAFLLLLFGPPLDSIRIRYGVYSDETGKYLERLVCSVYRTLSNCDIEWVMFQSYIL